MSDNIKPEEKETVGSQCQDILNEKLKEINLQINKLIVGFEKEYGEKVIAIGSVQRPGEYKNEERVELIMVY